jgi:hypothetical protein
MDLRLSVSDLNVISAHSREVHRIALIVRNIHLLRDTKMMSQNAEMHRERARCVPNFIFSVSKNIKGIQLLC